MNICYDDLITFTFAAIKSSHAIFTLLRRRPSQVRMISSRMSSAQTLALTSTDSGTNSPTSAAFLKLFSPSTNPHKHHHNTHARPARTITTTMPPKPTTPTPPSSPLKNTYLLAYNAISAALWAGVLYKTLAIGSSEIQRVRQKGWITSGANGPVEVFNKGLGSGKVYDELEQYTRLTQSLAGLEVGHSLVGAYPLLFPTFPCPWMGDLEVGD